MIYKKIKKKIKIFGILFQIIFCLIFQSSCKKNLSKYECEELSLRSFKGFPKASNDFKKNCTKYKITKFSHIECQKALTLLISTENIHIVKKKYSDRIINCFTKSDLEKFSKK